MKKILNKCTSWSRKWKKLAEKITQFISDIISLIQKQAIFIIIFLINTFRFTYTVYIEVWYPNNWQ